MPTDDAYTKTQRLHILERHLLAQPSRSWRTREVADLLHVSQDTAARYLEELSAIGRVPLITEGSTSDRSWRVSPASCVTLPPLHLDYAQGTALYAAARLLDQQQDDRNDAAHSALLALISVLPEPLRPHLEAIVTHLDEPAPISNVSRIFEALSQAWLTRRVVSLVYDPPHTSRYTCRFAPYLLEPSGIGRTLYFIGYSDPPGRLRTYKLERIQSAELTADTFSIPADFDGVARLRRAWGVMYGEEGDAPAHVKLRFSPFVSRRVRETRWHPSQTLTDTPEGLVWEADIGDITEIRPWIRGWGADCEVLDPAALRDEMIAEATRLNRLYGHQSPPQTTCDEPDPSFLHDLFGDD
jgi:predicted DNA-binding transcriptional regulator YafY